VNHISDIRTTAVVASIILFLPASILLGMVSPYAAKLKLDKLSTSGTTVGNLYAISTAGSIAGTFLAGFYLIPHFGVNKLLVLLSFSLFIAALILMVKKMTMVKTLFLLALIAGFAAFLMLYQAKKRNNLIDVDTAYNRIWIYDYQNKITGDSIRVFSINNEYSSAMYLNRADLVYDYTRYYHLASHFNPGFRRTLMIGGAGYSFPKDFLRNYPDATIDVAEIDPKVTDLAKQYFGLTDDSRLSVFNEDARVLLNRKQEKYDVIFGDAFNSRFSIPYQLTTREAVLRMYDILNVNGVVILNILSSLRGDKSLFLQAEYATYRQVFPQVFLFPVTDPAEENHVQNVMLVAIKSLTTPVFSSTDPEMNAFLQHHWLKEPLAEVPVLTDDFAPVDFYLRKILYN
jgi:spermidine synthase